MQIIHPAHDLMFTFDSHRFCWSLTAEASTVPNSTQKPGNLVQSLRNLLQAHGCCPQNIFKIPASGRGFSAEWLLALHSSFTSLASHGVRKWGVRKDHYRNGAQQKMAPKWLQKV